VVRVLTKVYRRKLDKKERERESVRKRKKKSDGQDRS
jgi:hypothetical protein